MSSNSSIVMNSKCFFRWAIILLNAAYLIISIFSVKLPLNGDGPDFSNSLAKFSYSSSILYI